MAVMKLTLLQHNLIFLPLTFQVQEIVIWSGHTIHLITISQGRFTGNLKMDNMKCLVLLLITNHCILITAPFTMLIKYKNPYCFGQVRKISIYFGSRQWNFILDLEEIINKWRRFFILMMSI